MGADILGRRPGYRSREDKGNQGEGWCVSGSDLRWDRETSDLSNKEVHQSSRNPKSAGPVAYLFWAHPDKQSHCLWSTTPLRYGER